MPPLTIDVISRDGEIATHAIDRAQAIAMFNRGGEAMVSAGLTINQRIVAKPSAKLTGLIAANASHRQAAEEVAE